MLEAARVRRFQAKSLCFQPSGEKTMQELTEVAREHGVYVGFSPSCLTPHRAHNLQYRAALFSVGR